MSREQVIEWMKQTGFANHADFLALEGEWQEYAEKFAANLERFAALVAAAERRKHQADIEAWKAEAVTAEKWRGMALMKDPMQPGKAVQVIQQEAAAAEREECAKVCERRAMSAGSLAQGFEALDCRDDIRARGKP